MIQSWLHRITSVSLAARVSFFVAITLWILAAMTWWVYASDPTRVPWGSYMTPQRGVTLGGLWLSCVVAVYACVRVATDDTPLGHAGARQAWRAGRRLMAHRAIRFRDVPCFLALGAASTRINSTLPITPEEPALETESDADESCDPCVHWRLQHRGLIVNVHGLGRYEPSRLRESIPETQRVPSAVQDLQDVQCLQLVQSRGEGEAGIDSLDVGKRASDAAERADEMILEVLQNAEHASADTRNLSIRTSAESSPLESSPLESSRRHRREQGFVEFLNRLRRERQPFASINGILAVVPSDVLSASEAQPFRNATRLGQQFRHDLQIVRQTLGMDAPVVLCVEASDVAIDVLHAADRTGGSAPWGLHLDPAQRWDLPSLHGLADRLVDAVVDRMDEECLTVVVDGQQRESVLSANRRRQGLAARCRSLRSPLQAFLDEAFAPPSNRLPIDTSSSTAQDNTRLSGLFLEHPDRIFAAEGILRVMQDQQHELQWTTQTQLAQSRRFIINLTLLLLCIGLVIAAVWQWQG